MDWARRQELWPTQEDASAKKQPLTSGFDEFFLFSVSFVVCVSRADRIAEIDDGRDGRIDLTIGAVTELHSVVTDLDIHIAEDGVFRICHIMALFAIDSRLVQHRLHHRLDCCRIGRIPRGHAVLETRRFTV